MKNIIDVTSKSMLAGHILEIVDGKEVKGTIMQLGSDNVGQLIIVVDYKEREQDEVYGQ